MIFAVHRGDGLGHFGFNWMHTGQLAQYGGLGGFDGLGIIGSFVVGQVQPHLFIPHARGHGGQYFCMSFMLQWSWFAPDAHCDIGMNWSIIKLEIGFVSKINSITWIATITANRNAILNFIFNDYLFWTCTYTYILQYTV